MFPSNDDSQVRQAGYAPTACSAIHGSFSWSKRCPYFLVEFPVQSVQSLCAWPVVQHLCRQQRVIIFEMCHDNIMRPAVQASVDCWWLPLVCCYTRTVLSRCSNVMALPGKRIAGFVVQMPGKDISSALATPSDSPVGCPDSQAVPPTGGSKHLWTTEITMTGPAGSCTEKPRHALQLLAMQGVRIFHQCPRAFPPVSM